MKFINQHEIVCSSFFARFCFLSLSFNSLLSFSFVLTVHFFSFSSYFSVSVHIGQFLFMFSTFCSIFDLFQVFQLLTSPYFISGSSYYFTYVAFSCSLHFSSTLSIPIRDQTNLTERKTVGFLPWEIIKKPWDFLG